MRDHLVFIAILAIAAWLAAVPIVLVMHPPAEVEIVPLAPTD